MDERRIKAIVEEEFQRLVSKNMNDRNPFIMDRLQALEDKMEYIEEKSELKNNLIIHTNFTTTLLVHKL